MVGGEQYKNKGKNVKFERGERPQGIKTGREKAMNMSQGTKRGRKRRRGERKTNKRK